MPVRQSFGEEAYELLHILGPLINPGRPSIQLLGVFSRDFVEALAAALQSGAAQGLSGTYFSNGDTGMDELACCGTCHVAGLENLLVCVKRMPDALGLDVCSLDDVQGGDLEEHEISMKFLG